MDLGAAALAIVAFTLGGIFNAVVGVATGEYRARQDENRLAHRTRSDRRREFWLAETLRTRTMLSTDLLRLLALARGDKDLEAQLQSNPAGPGARADLLGDADVAREFYELETRLFYLPPGRGVPEQDLRAWVVTMGRVASAFDAQERRLMNDEEPVLISLEDMASIPTWRTTFPRPPGASASD